MTARARHDCGDRRIYPDADACGIGASIQTVQALASARPSSPRPASPRMPGHARTTGESPPVILPSRRTRCTKRVTSASPTLSDGPHREQTATTPMLARPAQKDPLWAAEKTGSRGARTAQNGGSARGLSREVDHALRSAAGSVAGASPSCAFVSCASALGDGRSVGSGARHLA